jgi:polysaccharide pyruvyl transferase WcaK-like protein
MRDGIRPQFFPGQVSSDPAAIKDIVDRLDVRPNPPSIGTVPDLMSFLSTADVVVASRFHGVLLALLLRRPVIAVSYERKVRQLMADCGQAELCLEIENARVDQLLRTYSSVMNRRHEIAAEIDARVRRQTGAVLAQFDLVASSLLPKPRLVRRKAEDAV